MFEMLAVVLGIKILNWIFDVDGNEGGAGISLEDARKAWHALHKQLKGDDGYLCDTKTIEDIKKEIEEFKKELEIKQETAQLEKLLVKEWQRLCLEVYGWEPKGYYESFKKLKRDVDDLPARKPLVKEWRKLHAELFGSEGCLSPYKTSGEIRKEIDIWKNISALENQWRGDKNLIIAGTIVGYEQRLNELGLRCWVVRIDIDKGRNGILPLGELDSIVQNNVRRDFRRMTGRSPRSFDEAYPMYDGKRIRAKIAKVSPWKQGSLPEFELTEGVVEGYTGRETPPDVPQGAGSEASGEPNAKTQKHSEGHGMNESQKKEWHNLHMELFATYGQCESKSDEEIQNEIKEFQARKALCDQWRALDKDLYGFERPADWLVRTSTEAIQKEIEDFPSRKPLLAKLRQLHPELFEHLSEGQHYLGEMTSKDLQTEIDAYPKRERLCEEWRRLYKEVFALDSKWCDGMPFAFIEREIAEFRQMKQLLAERSTLLESIRQHNNELYDELAQQKPKWKWTLSELQKEVEVLREECEKRPLRAQLCKDWLRLYNELEKYGSSLCNRLTIPQLQEDIALFEEKNELVNKLWKLSGEVIDGGILDAKDKYEMLHHSSVEELQSKIDELIERKPVLEEWWAFCNEYQWELPFGRHARPAKVLRAEVESWKKAVVWEEILRSKGEVTVEGTISGHEWRENLGRTFCVTFDGGGQGYLPLAALAKKDQDRIGHTYRVKTGRSIRRFEDVYPLYEGVRVRAQLVGVSEWRRDGSIPQFELAKGEVVKNEGNDKPMVGLSESTPQLQADRAKNEDNSTRPGAELHLGDVLVGHVQNTAQYGVFVDLEEGVTGLLHVKDMGLGYVRALAAVFGKGDAVKVEVTGISEKDGRRRVGFRLLEFPDKAPLAAGAGKERPTLLLDGPGLWRSFGDWKGKGLAMLLDACRKARRRAVLVTDAGLERDMEQTGDADGLALMRDLRENHPSSLFVCPEGADSVASAMRRRACIQQCRIVSNDAALASAVGVEACSVASDAGGLSVPELGLQCESTTADGKASRRTTSKILVDGVNCTRAQLGGKGLATILGALKEAGRVPFTFFDASMQGKPDKDLQALILRLTASGEACVVPSGSDMDDYLLPMADSCGLDIVTNKRFHGKEGKYPWLTKRTEEGKRLHPFSVVDGMLLIPSLDICTPLEHGTVTKEVTEANT